MIEFTMKRHHINWNDENNIKIIRDAAPAYDTLKGLAEFLGISYMRLTYVLNKYLPEERKKYKMNRANYSYADIKVACEECETMQEVADKIGLTKDYMHKLVIELYPQYLQKLGIIVHAKHKF